MSTNYFVEKCKAEVRPSFCQIILTKIFQRVNTPTDIAPQQTFACCLFPDFRNYVFHILFAQRCSEIIPAL